MKRNVLLIIIILFLAACDKAQVMGSADGESTEGPGRMIILNNLGETLSIAYPNGNIRNDVQLTGESPNDMISDSPYIYIINSLSNSVLVLKENDLSVVTEIALGPGKNPMSACVISPGTVAVSCFRSGTVEIVDVIAGRVINSISLNNIILPQDISGISGKACPTGIAYVSGMLFVCLSNLTDAYGGLTASGPGVVATINTDSLSVTGIITLNGSDPVYVKANGSKVIVACAGHYSGDIRTGSGGFKGDGTIEVIDTTTLTLESTVEIDAAPFSFSISEAGILYTSNAMGGTIARIDLADSRTTYIATGASFISGVCYSNSGIKVLDFSSDRLMVIDEAGNLMASYITGDGPIAILEASSAVREEIIIEPKMDILPDVTSAGSEVLFDASSSAAPEDAGVSWDFGDGTTAQGKTVRHRYLNAGVFYPELRISYLGQSESVKGNINVLSNSPFATEVIEYLPAPGQFILSTRFNNPMRALGAPRGGGGFQPDNSSQVSLGGFGGSITLVFDHEIKDVPGKFDFIVFGNSQYDQAPSRFVEPGIVEISDDAVKWFVIPGSMIDSFPVQKTCKSYSDTFDEFCTYELASGIEDRVIDGKYTLWGYADLSPVIPIPDGSNPWVFYTLADDPFMAGISDGACGGDAFDIAWAVDPETGQPSGLTGFRYIRISTAVSKDLGAALGECSTEIDAVAEIKNK
jgi:hypothetical protein